MLTGTTSWVLQAGNVSEALVRATNTGGAAHKRQRNNAEGANAAVAGNGAYPREASALQASAALIYSSNS